MEAAEYAVAEGEPSITRQGSVTALRADGIEVFVPKTRFPTGFELPFDQDMSWAIGQCIWTGLPVATLADGVTFHGRGTEVPDFAMHTNGLGAGFSVEQATQHALLELIERDAGSLWAISNSAARVARSVSLSELGEVACALASRLEQNDFLLKVFDITTDLSVPSVTALIAPNQGRGARLIDVSAGTASAEDSETAVIKAITEAAQSRITAIAGARDDITPNEYRDEVGSGYLDLLTAQQSQEAIRPMKSASLRHALELAGIRHAYRFDLPAPRGLHVCRVVVPELEDWGVNKHWRPGARAIRHILNQHDRRAA